MYVHARRIIRINIGFPCSLLPKFRIVLLLAYRIRHMDLLFTDRDHGFYRKTII